VREGLTTKGRSSLVVQHAEHRAGQCSQFAPLTFVTVIHMDDSVMTTQQYGISINCEDTINPVPVW